MTSLPGTPEHQKLLQEIINYYQDDTRIRAIVLFGSLARGTWDRYSDIDLDIIIINEAIVRIEQELEQLCEYLRSADMGDALVVPDGPEAGYVVLTSLLQFAIRYHPLMTTNPNIIDDMIVLSGRISAEIIQNAGRANRIHGVIASKAIIAQCVRSVVEVDAALQRKRPWMAVDLLHRARHLLMALYSESRGAGRTVQYFEAEADAVLQEKLGKAVCGINEESLNRSLMAMLELLENDLDDFCDTPVTLSETQRVILENVRRRREAVSV